MVVMRRSTQEQFRGEPPVGNINALLGILEGNRNSPEVVQSVDVPLDVVALALWKVGFEAVRLACRCSFRVASFLVFLVMTMTPIELDKQSAIYTSMFRIFKVYQVA